MMKRFFYCIVLTNLFGCSSNAIPNIEKSNQQTMKIDLVQLESDKDDEDYNIKWNLVFNNESSNKDIQNFKTSKSAEFFAPLLESSLSHNFKSSIIFSDNINIKKEQNNYITIFTPIAGSNVSHSIVKDNLTATEQKNITKSMNILDNESFIFLSLKLIPNLQLNNYELYIDNIANIKNNQINSSCKIKIKYNAEKYNSKLYNLELCSPVSKYRYFLVVSPIEGKDNN